MNIRFVCCCRPRYLIGSGSNRRCLIMTLMKSQWRAVGFPSAPWYEIFSFVSRLKWTVEFVEVCRWTSHSAAQSEGAVWMLHRTPPWLSDCCQNVNVYTARPSFRLYRRRDSIIRVCQLCLDVFFSPPCLCREKKAAIVTRGFCACGSLCARVRVNRWDYPRGLIVSYSSPPIKKGGICIAQSLKIPHNPKLEDYDKTIQQLLETHHSRAVIIFASEEDIRWGAQHNSGFIHGARALLMICHV